MEINHFSHEHKLHLQEHGYYSTKLPYHHFCNGCWQPLSISNSYYTCHDCQYYLHKRCADQPIQISYPLHRHPLTLLPQPRYRSHRCYCSSCYRSQWQHFTYHCSTCNYDLDIECAIRAGRIKHRSHHHPLIPLQKSASFFCRGCRNRDADGPSYVCPDCDFWVHQKCAHCFPWSVVYEHNQSHHPLQISYGFPRQLHGFLSFCEICEEKLNRADWVYFCSDDCRYFVHSDCLVKKMKKETALSSSNMNENEIEDDSKITHLPPLDEFMNPSTLFIMGLSLVDNHHSLIEHPSHEHELILVESEKDTILLNEHTKHEQTCAGCCSPVISPPFYKCIESDTSNCAFLLHKQCAHLPEKLNRHPSHPDHPLVISMETYGIVKCNSCKKICLGFVFSCHNCRFHLDVACASLPDAITHEIHQHSKLVKREFRESDGHRCRGCNFLLCGTAFTCISCDDFKIDVECALLPRALNHRFDEHPFRLSYSPVNGIEEYVCGICEHDINPRQWFYCCGICDQAIHSECILPVGHPTVAFNPGNVFYNPHHDLDHGLILEQSIDQDEGVVLSCDCCGKGIRDGFECFQCWFRIHRECADMPQHVKVEWDDHPLQLRSRSASEEKRVRFCRLCGVEIDREIWFYYCGGICDNYAHLECVSNYQVVLTQSSKHGQLKLIWRIIPIE